MAAALKEEQRAALTAFLGGLLVSALILSDFGESSMERPRA